MTLYDLKSINLNLSFDFADDEIDATFYCELADITDAKAKKIEVISIDENYITCKFTNFLRHQKTKLRKYLRDTYYVSWYNWLVGQLVASKDITSDGGEAVYHFIENDLEAFLTME